MNERSENINTIVLQHSTTADRPRVKTASPAARLMSQQWQPGAGANIEALFKERLHEADSKSVILDLAYEEYCLRAEQGETPDVFEFARRQPAYETSIIRLLEIHRLLSFAETRESEPIAWPAPGDSILGFQLIEELGRGGFARVYLAEEQELDHRPVVVKVSEMGVDEGKILARLSHPNIVPIHSIRSHPTNGITLICMPFCGRRTCWDLLHHVKTRGVPRSAEKLAEMLPADGAEPSDSPSDRSKFRLSGHYTEFVMRTGIALAEALACAHELGICHGDIKPSNILLTPVGEPMLLDFNLAVKGDRAAGGGGTLPYMAPEQLTAVLRTDGQTAVTPRTDLYALGIVLYELLTGKEPFGPVPTSQSRAEVCGDLLERRRQGPRPIREFNPDVDAALERLVLKCLAYSADDRPRTARLLAQSLRNNLRFTNRVQRWLSRHRRLVQSICALTLAATVLLAYSAYRREPYPLRMLHQGSEAYFTGEMKVALASAEKALDSDPRLTEAWILRARARQEMGDYTPAIEDYATAYGLSGDPLLRAAEAYCWQQMGHHQEAIALFNEAIVRGGRTAEVLNDLGYSYLQSANFDQANSYLSQAIKLNPKLQPALHNRAKVQINLSLNSENAPSEQARDDINKAIELGSPSAELYQDAAVLYKLREMHGAESSGGAKAHLARALEYGLSLKSCQDNPLLSDLLPPEPNSNALKAGTKAPPAVRIVDPLPPSASPHPASASSSP